MREEILEKLKKILADELGVKEEEIKEESDLKNDLGADSLALSELVMRIEEEESFGIESIPDDVADKIETVGDIITAITNLKKK